MPWPQWSFDTYEFPIADSPMRGGSDDVNVEEKLVYHELLQANVTIVTSWGFSSGRRTITGVCGQATRDQMRTFHQNGTVGTLRDGEDRSITARIIVANFVTIIPGLRYRYTLEFIQR